ncbi:MAG: ligase-associated DNA damage response DEXH box helicase [Flavobacteriaceae bacterium]|nr:ligase-associated DNA damage response DEXH box helicase [Flavobacteriaceae bacterium]MDG2387355.1 ligase-associated DNA damage response DEXH box helicase [Flavobacteriaceae bacterium]
MKNVEQWFKSQKWNAQSFQKQCWKAYAAGKNGMLHAPTGSGKTYALWGGIVAEMTQTQKPPKGLNALWITPLRALGVEIQKSTQKMLADFNPELHVGLRTADTPQNQRAKLLKTPPFGLVSTPESVHVLLANKNHQRYFSQLKVVVVDEWHELLGSKRGVQVELALAYLRSLLPNLKVWGISATLGNKELAREILLGPTVNFAVIEAKIQKKIRVHSLLPKTMQRFPWRGHLGIHLLPQVLKIVQKNKSTLIFTNTRAQCEIWFHRILEASPELAGSIAMHHGSIDKKIRLWVEEALRNETLKVVVCTSSLDLGVDFSPVENCIQIGSPKGVGRFIQRAGRSGHQPKAGSSIYFLPTHAMELIESVALQKGIKNQQIEDRIPYLNSYDVLIQFLMTLAVGAGFDPVKIYPVVTSSFCFQALDQERWRWILNFLIRGSQSLQHYDEYKKLISSEEGLLKAANKGIALRHRLSMGTIVSGNDLKIRYQKGGYLGSIEEWFIAKLKPGDTFAFSGKNLELLRIQKMEVIVKKSKVKQAKIPAWMGGRMSFSAHLSDLLKEALFEDQNKTTREFQSLLPVFDQQKKESVVPQPHELLIERFETKEGFHTVFYPFEGYALHEAMASLLAYRISLLSPISFSMSYNDYGFELLSDQAFSQEAFMDNNLFSSEHLFEDLVQSINISEMARRRFRDIAVISGLVFQGFPNKPIKSKHLQSGSQLFFEVFKDYEPDNLLYQQAIEETFDHGMERGRMQLVFEALEQKTIVWKNCSQPTPFSFPLITDRMRSKLSSESVEDRIKKMYLQLEKAATE